MLFFFSFLLSSTQLNFNHTQLLARKGHPLPLPQNNDQAEEQCDYQYGISTLLYPFPLLTFHLSPVTLCLQSPVFLPLRAGSLLGNSAAVLDNYYLY